jgi:hypothetical protein
VQQRFAGALLATGQLVSLHIDRANVVGIQKSFAVQRRSAKYFVLANPDGNVPVVCGGEAFGVNPSSNFTDVLFNAMSVHGFGSEFGVRSSEFNV